MGPGGLRGGTAAAPAAARVRDQVHRPAAEPRDAGTAEEGKWRPLLYLCGTVRSSFAENRKNFDVLLYGCYYSKLDYSFKKM